MTRATTSISAPAGDLAAAWQGFRWHHPEWSLATAAALAWMALFAMSGNADEAGQPGADAAKATGLGGLSHLHHGLTGAHNGHQSTHLSMAHWTLMVVAMMLPTILPMARSIALDGRWRRRQRGQALFAAGYLGAWIGVGLIAVTVLQRAGLHVTGGWALAGMLAVASIWELTVWKLRFLRVCHRVRPIPPDGWRADGICVWRGLCNARSCLGACWAMMAVMLVADHLTAVWLMPTMTLAMVAEKWAAKPRTVVRPVAAVLAALAVVVTI
jgi:predicted metal-binding membrane protein